MWLLVVWLFFAVVVGAIAFDKGRSFFGWFLMAAIASPLIAGVLLIAAGQGERGTRVCPACAERVLKEAVICKHCGVDIGAAYAAVKLTQRPVKHGIAWALGWTR